MKYIELIIPISLIILIIYLLYKSNDVIKYNLIKIPKNKKYLKGIYLKGLNIKAPNNLLFTIDSNTINLLIEDNNKVHNYKIKFNEIKKIDYEIEPYHYIKNNEEYEIRKNETIKKVKVIKSYYVKMILKNNITYEFICFKKPNKFFKEVNK